VKLASELQKRTSGRAVYVLDEPTTGLHFDDIRKLLLVVNGLVDKGNSVIVIEHNLDVIKTADWVLDMGPEGGAGGGTLVAQGTPEHIASVSASYTGSFLQDVLAPGAPGAAAAPRTGPVRKPAARRVKEPAAAR
jgi:excinuclease ABC subunit A